MINFFILFFILLLFLVISIIIFKGDFLSPSIITSFVFFLSSLAVLMNLSDWDVNFDIKTIIVVFISFITIIFTELFFRKTSPSPSHKNCDANPVHVNNSKLLLFDILSSISLLIFTLYIRRLGESIGATGLLAIGKVKDSTAVTVGGIPLIAFDICFYTSFAFIYIFCRNVFSAKQSIKYNLKYLFPVLIGIIAVIFRGARGPLFQYLVSFFFLALFFSGSHKTKVQKSRRKILWKTFCGLFIFSLAFYLLREIVKGRTSNVAFFDYLTYYLGSPLLLFDQYLSGNSNVYLNYHYFGVATFTNLYGTLYQIGLITKPVSGLNYLTWVSPSSGISISGNEFTIFMRPLYDFGIFGLQIFLFAFYGMFDFIYYRKLLNQSRSTQHQKFLVFYSMYFYSVVMSFYYCFTAQDFRPQSLIFILFVFSIINILCHNKKPIFSPKNKMVKKRHFSSTKIQKCL
jgi:oligosaccharide repeat unit polymerase